MKIKCLQVCILPIAAVAFVSGCVVEPNGQLAFAPIVVAPAPVYVQPAPVVEEQVMVPDTYFWDGYENVGIINGQYFYLGAGDVWLVAEPFRLERFHGWERDHPDWRDHGIRNDHYRRDAHGREQPRRDDHANGHDDHAKAAPVKKDEKKKDEH
jgi:hypothetical protein